MAHFLNTKIWKRILQLPFEKLYNNLTCNLNIYLFIFFIFSYTIELQRRTLQDDRNRLVTIAQYLYFNFLVNNSVKIWGLQQLDAAGSAYCAPQLDHPALRSLLQPGGNRGSPGTNATLIGHRRDMTGPIMLYICIRNKYFLYILQRPAVCDIWGLTNL